MARRREIGKAGKQRTDEYVLVMKRKILCVFAHPDDEAFGPGGTIAKYANEGVEIHLLCATRGEKGEWQNKELRIKNEFKIEDARENELLKSAEILGIRNVEFLDFVDGTLSNSNYHKLAKKIIAKIKSYKPAIILTTERLGISGHLDHIAVSMVTTYSFFKSNEAVKLYYFCLSKSQRRDDADDYFVYYPEGYDEDLITTRIDYSGYFEIKKKAMLSHQSQMKDIKDILSQIEKKPKIDNFILQANRLKKVNIRETDLFAGLK